MVEDWRDGWLGGGDEGRRNGRGLLGLRGIGETDG